MEHTRLQISYETELTPNKILINCRLSYKGDIINCVGANRPSQNLIQKKCCRDKNWLGKEKILDETCGFSWCKPIRNKTAAIQRTWCQRNACPVISISHMSLGEPLLKRTTRGSYFPTKQFFPCFHIYRAKRVLNNYLRKYLNCTQPHFHQPTSRNADWTYLNTNERANERTNERKNELTNEKAISLIFLCVCGKKSKENLQKRRFSALPFCIFVPKIINKLDADWTYLMMKVRQREKT